jgi:dipeptidyl-peptidase-3
LLGEIQRIVSEGDAAAANALIDKFARKVDPELQAEVLSRLATIKIGGHTGYVTGA